MDTKEDFLLWFTNFLIKSQKYSGNNIEMRGINSGITIEMKPSEQLAEELHKPIIRKF